MISELLLEVKPQIKSSKRELSNHVCSRYYRAPEIVLHNTYYDTKVDMWSLGCIFAELVLKVC